MNAGETTARISPGRRLLKFAARMREHVQYGPIPSESDYRQSIVREAGGNDLVRKMLANDDPCLVTRLGDVELRTITYYLRWRDGWWPRPGYPVRQRLGMRNSTGFFPADDRSLDRFVATTLHAASQADIMAVWFNREEDRVVREFCPSARLIELNSLNCMCYDRPWSSELAGRTVLVVHPFARSIESQYRERRTQIFANPDVLPEFNLKTLIPVQTIAGNECEHASWFDALSHMCHQIEIHDFDVAIIGAGAYGLPLAAFVKSMGRQAVHMGGATQLLFGIKGRRWERYYLDSINPLFNDAWVRPLPEETPRGAENVEQGCYW